MAGVTLYIWMDGSYQNTEEEGIDPPSWKSDDFYVVEVPEDVEDIDEFAYLYVHEADLGTSTDSRTKLG